LKEDEDDEENDIEVNRRVINVETVMAFGRFKPDTDRRRDRRSSSMGQSVLD